MRSTQKQWCPVCRFNQYPPHFHPEIAAPSYKTDADRGVTFLNFRERIAAETIVFIAVQPQILCRPRRLVVSPAKAAAFELLDVRIGIESHLGAWSCDGGVGCDAFPPIPKGREPIDNLAGLPAIMPGQNLLLMIKNATDRVETFRAIVYAEPIRMDHRGRRFDLVELHQAEQELGI